MHKKEISFMGLVGFEGPLRVEKNPAPWKKKFRFGVKVNIYLKSSIHLKSENVNVDYKGAAGKNFESVKFCISKWENGRWMNWPPPS